MYWKGKTRRVAASALIRSSRELIWVSWGKEGGAFQDGLILGKLRDWWDSVT